MPTQPVSSTAYGRPVPTKTVVNWGAVVKGAAIVTAAVVVGYVGYLAINSLLASSAVTGIMDNQTVSSLAGTVVEKASLAWDWLSAKALWIGGQISEYWAAIPEKWGLTQTLATQSGTIAAVTGGAGVAKIAATAGGVVIGAGALHMANNTIHNTAFTTTVPDMDAAHAYNNGVMSSMAHTTHAANVAHMNIHDIASHHAAEQSWVERSGGKPAQKQQVEPRKSSYAEQLNADTANLSSALTK